MEEIKFDVIERVCEKQNFRELLLHIIKNSSGNRINKMLEDIENNNKIDKKMKRKIVTGCSGPIIWIGILIRHCVGWRWRKERI